MDQLHPPGGRKLEGIGLKEMSLACYALGEELA